MSNIRLFWQMTAHVNVLLAVIALLPATAFGQSVVGQNTNAVGPTPDGFYRGIPHYQDNEPHCDRNPLLPSNIICMGNGYGGADDDIGDAWPRIYESQDNARTWLSRYATGSAADLATSLGLGFGADPIMVCWPGGCGGFFIASNRAEGGGMGGGVYMQLMPEFNIEAGFRHFSEAGPRTVQLGSGGTFLDKIDAIFLVDTQNPGTVPVTMTVNRGGFTETVTRTWPRGRLVVVYAAINASQQNIRIFSTYSDNYGANWSPPKQVANTTGLDTGVAVAAIDDTILYAYRQFQDGSGDQLDAVFAAVSTTRGRTIRKPFAVVENLCAFDQPTVAIPASSDPDSPPFDTVASRTNNFVDVSGDGSNFVMVLAEKKRDLDGGCSTKPFDYPAGSRVLVTTAGSNGRGWKTPVPIAPLADFEEPRVAPYPLDRHSFQFMPAVDCVLGVCQAIWYDSINDSNRNISFLTGNSEAPGFDPAAADAFINFPLFGDFFYPSPAGILQFRRTADVWTRQFKIVDCNNVAGCNIDFSDDGPVQVSKYQLARIAPEVVVEVEQNPFSLKQYKGNTVSFMGDYIGLASKKLRSRVNPDDPTGPPIYEPNYGPDPLNLLLKPSWFAYWTDTRKARGLLYTLTVEESLPFLKTDAPTGGSFTNLEESLPGAEEDGEVISGARKLSAEGVEDSNAVGFCDPLTGEGETVPGESRDVRDYPNRIKDADVYGALIKVPATAWVLNASKGLGLQARDEDGNPLGDLQRTYVIAARNDARENGKTFRFEIANQPAEDGRASWLQFEQKTNVYEDVGPQSSVTVALFVVSDLPVNPVTVNVYEVPFGDRTSVGTLVETLVVNGALEAGDLINADGTFVDINSQEIHNPFVYVPDSFDPDILNPEVWNPEVWNPEVWNPEVWNPEVWNPEVWNPEVWNPEVWNPEVWNPEVWNPEVWNVSLTDGDDLDNPEIPSPDLTDLQGYQPGALVERIDVQFSAENLGNTITPYTADFAANSPIVREAIASGDVRTQIIVWQDVDLDSYQGCDPDEIVAGDTPGQNRILAVVNNADLLDLKIPTIADNRFGSVTYYSVPNERVQITIRFIGLLPTDPDLLSTIQMIGEEIVNGGISYVVTSQAANTGQISLCPDDPTNCAQAIEDSIPPTFSANSGELLTLPATGPGGAVLPADFVTASKNGLDLDVSCSPYDLEGAPVPIDPDPTSITCEATTPPPGNVPGSVTFDLLITKDPPVITPGTNQTFEANTAGGANIAAGDIEFPIATDFPGTFDINLPVSCEPDPVPNPSGFYPLDDETSFTCSATDDAGQTVSTDFTVSVFDTTPPTLTVPENITEELDTPTGTSVSFVATATDIADPNPVVTCIPGSPSIFTPGPATPVECTATDAAGLTDIQTFTVTVVDTKPPEITDGIDQSFEANRVGGVTLDANEIIFPTATDFGDPIDVSCDNDPDGFYPLGTTGTVVSCTATDGVNTVSTSFNIAVVDTTPPDLTVPADITTTVGASVTFDALMAEDIADASPVVECAPSSGSTFSFGTTTVTCTATDAYGNSDSGTFTVTASLGTGSGLDSNKNSVKAGSVAGFDWIWLDGSGNPVDVGEGNQDIEARLITAPLKTCNDPQGVDVLNEDPGSSGIRRSGDGWQFNWQTQDDAGSPIAKGFYCVSVILLTTSEPPTEVQRQSTEIRVRP